MGTRHRWRVTGAPAPVGNELDADIKFSPVYSSYDGEHTFQVPVTVKGYSGIKWETDKQDLVDLDELNPNTVMITTRGAGTAKIIARAGRLSGSTTLNITKSTRLKNGTSARTAIRTPQC